MPVTLDDAKRSAIAMKLADMRAIQELLMSNEERFIREGADQEISNRFQSMLDDDRKNMGVLETVIVQYGIQAQPKQTTQMMIEQARGMMEGSELTLFEKVTQHELLKHAQTMSGLLIHKCAQVVGADIEAAITPLNTVNFENRAHQEQLKGIMEVLGVRELTGQEADQGLWGRVQDAMAALSGVVGSAVTRSDDEMTIRQIIRMDHTKTNTLFAEIAQSNDAQKMQEYFGQLYKDLTAHAKAEEEVVYPAVSQYYQKTDDLYQEQAQQEQMLNEIQSMSPSSPDFKNRVSQLQSMTQHHINQEESEMFGVIGANMSHEQEKQMATRFKEAKARIQQQMGVVGAK
jgi:hemerythrin superfamily protein